MRAWIIKQHGGPEVFKEVELPTPNPGPGEVRIKVAATSVNPVDYKIRSGAAEALCPPKPALLHGDVSGVVDAVGEGVDRFAAGDAVYGCVGGYGTVQGVLADYAIANEWRIWNSPEEISLVDAAALPLVGITAYEGIRKARIDDRMHVLVHGGTGGVGHIAIQAIKHIGARVAATVSTPEKAEIAKQLGADDIINYKEQSVDQYTNKLTKRGFDAVFDTVGGPNLAASIEAVTPNGQVVCIQGRTEIDGGLLHAKGVSLHLVFMLIPMLQDIPDIRHMRTLKDLSGLIKLDMLKPLIDDKRFTFDQIGDAHAYAESGEQVGKVLVVHPDRA